MTTIFAAQALTPAGFARFQHHARRIVHVDVLNHSPYDVSIWQELARMNGNKPLLPRLRHCGWYVGAPFSDELLPCLPPSLRSLDVKHWNRSKLYGPEVKAPTRWKIRQQRMLGSRDTLTDYMAVRLSETVPDLSRIRICSKFSHILGVLCFARAGLASA